MNNEKHSSNKNDNNQIVAQTEYKVSAVTYSVATEDLNYSEPNITWLPNAYEANKRVSISIENLEPRINSYKKPGDKKDSSGILKGLFEGGFSGVHCVLPAPYLFYDIDVENSEIPAKNKHLLTPTNNMKVFEELEKLSVLSWRSNSGYGIAGILYVPQIAQYTSNTTDRHLIVGQTITYFLTDYLHKTTGVRVVFDQQQSKFRQIRYVADQRGRVRKLNPRPFVFSYTSEEVVKKTQAGVINYRYSDYRPSGNSVYSQFNSNTDIWDVLQKNGFNVVADSGNKIRVKHHSSDSSSSGFINKDKNTYVNFSSTFDSSGKTTFRPSDIVCKFEFDYNWKKFRLHLHAMGYKDKPVTETQAVATSKSLKEKLKGVLDEDQASKIIFSHCLDLKYASSEMKRQFIADNCTLPEFKKHFEAHLNFVDYKIEYDKQLTISMYVAEVLPNILDYADKHNKVILRADTGKGKTTAFIRDFHTHRPNGRIMIMASLTIIVHQNQRDYNKKAVFLTGNSDGFDHQEARDAKIVFATYEQGTKHLEHHTFDYIIIDEVHQLLTANSFKSNAIAEMTALFKDSKIIGLTGTPSNIFSLLGFKLLDVDVEQPSLMSGAVRYSNRSVSNIVMTHLMYQPKGKVLIRVNAIETCKAIIKELINKKIYKKSEVLLLYSSLEIKKSDDYEGLAYKRKFSDKIRIVFTTAMIDEGLSIDQFGFTDVLFIETSYEHRPEPIKQFFARFRNEDPNRKNYLYLRQKKLQIQTQFRPETMFEEDLNSLITKSDDKEALDVLTTYNNLFSNNNYYYNDAQVNLFYLAFAATQVLFQHFNSEQFLDYLKSNFNLSFQVDEKYEVQKLETGTKEQIKQVKQKVAKYWCNANSQILQVLLYQSQNPYITKNIHKQQIQVERKCEEFIKDNIKYFETLYLRDKELRSLGITKPLEVLIKNEGDEVTLQSCDKYNKRVTVLKVNKAIHHPITKADRKTAEQFIEFAQRCLKLGRFTNMQMNDELKKCGVINYKAFKNEEMLFEILRDFDLKVKRDKRKNIIICTG